MPSLSLPRNRKIKVYKTIILSNVLCGRERLSLTLREVRVFETGFLRKMFGSNGEDVTGHWRKLLNEELYDSCCLASVFGVINTERICWVGHVACVGRRDIHARFWWGKVKKEKSCKF